MAYHWVDQFRVSFAPWWSPTHSDRLFIFVALPSCMEERVAIIDMGTNTFHLMVAQVGLPPKILFRYRTAVKIGQGGINAGIITPEAAQRALKTLKEYRSTVDKLKVNHVLAFGTSALRSAANGKSFVEQILKETGIDTRIIDGEEEASLIYEGVRGALSLGPEKSLIVDVGGGSVEFIIANEKEVFWKGSFEVGGQRLLELFHRHDPILTSEVEELNEHASRVLRPLFQQLEMHKPDVLVGVSGTFDTLSEIYCRRLGLPYSPDDPETPLTLEDFYSTSRLLVERNRTERMAIPGMIEMRVDMIVVACCLVKLVLDRYPVTSIRVSTWSLKEGALIRWCRGGVVG
jgi:exopolyphosphatase/guanosine-5'-triphosphate,3'-diphosphate pyrophosphatase